MSDAPRPLPRIEREAYRALLEDALADMAAGKDPERAANDVMRALDAYIEASGGGTAASPRESPVTDFERNERDQLNWAKWMVVGGGVLATVTVAIAFSGGWPAGLAIIGIWVLALIALMST